MTAPARPRWAPLVAVILALVAADQVTKFLAVQHLTYAFEEANAVTTGEQLRAYAAVHEPHTKPPVVVVPGFWSHHYAENKGAAWSLLRDVPTAVRVPFFITMATLALVLLGVYWRRTLPEQRLVRAALAILAGGAAGNLVDRILRGHVIDFIDWHLNDAQWARPDLHWPTFNIADVGLSTGVGLIVLDSLLTWLRERRGRPARATGA